MSNDQNSKIAGLIDNFVIKINDCIQNNNTENKPQLNLENLCMNTLKEVSFFKDASNVSKITQDFFIA